MSARYPSLDGHGVVITGGATGIGAALVRAFVAQGSRTAFLDIADEPGHALAAETGAAYHHCDLRDVDALKRVMAAIGPVGVLVNNAAWDQRHDVETTTEALWDDMQSVNLKPHFFTAQAAAPGMVAAGGGSIVNLSSIAHLEAVPGMPGYLAAKAGIVGLTRGLARDLGDRNIRVNAVLPGWVRTPRQEALWLTPDAEAGWLKDQFLGRLLEPEDVARLVLFLASDDAAMITGQAYVIDGGR